MVLLSLLILHLCSGIRRRGIDFYAETIVCHTASDNGRICVLVPFAFSHTPYSSFVTIVLSGASTLSHNYRETKRYANRTDSSLRPSPTPRSRQRVEPRRGVDPDGWTTGDNLPNLFPPPSPVSQGYPYS